MKRPGGTVLLVAVVLSILCVRISRVTLPLRDESPAFHMEKPGYVLVYLGRGFPKQGYKQYIDGISPLDVIRMAGVHLPDKQLDSLLDNGALRSGEAVEIVASDGQVTNIKRFYLHAAQRITLGIPLHPDSMNASDWQALPGIGPCLAQRIVLDRQKNGEFGRIEALSRVKGIGAATIKRLRNYF